MKWSDQVPSARRVKACKRWMWRPLGGGSERETTLYVHANGAVMEEGRAAALHPREWAAVRGGKR